MKMHGGGRLRLVRFDRMSLTVNCVTGVFQFRIIDCLFTHAGSGAAVVGLHYARCSTAPFAVVSLMIAIAADFAYTNRRSDACMALSSVLRSIACRGDKAHDSPGRLSVSERAVHRSQHTALAAIERQLIESA